MRPPLSHPNGTVSTFLEGYFSASEACLDHPWLDCIFSGVLALRTDGDTGTRSLSRKVLFLILKNCRDISKRDVQGLLGDRYASRTIERYAAAARVAAKAIEARGVETPTKSECSLQEARRLIDAPYAEDLARAEAASVPWQPTKLVVKEGHGIATTWMQAERRTALESAIA